MQPHRSIRLDAVSGSAVGDASGAGPSSPTTASLLSVSGSVEGSVVSVVSEGSEVGVAVML